MPEPIFLNKEQFYKFINSMKKLDLKRKPNDESSFPLDFIVFYKDRYKVGAVGLRVIDKGINKHGFALNVNKDILEYFSLIDPCGLIGYTPYTLAEILGKEFDMDDVMETAVKKFVEVFGYKHVNYIKDLSEVPDKGEEEKIEVV